MSKFYAEVGVPAMRPSALALLVPVALSAAAASRAETPLLYLPFDGNLQAAVSGGAGVPKAADERMQFRPGLRGGALLNGDLRWNTAGCFQRDAGTIAFWLRPTWPGNDKLTRTLFSLYGTASCGSRGSSTAIASPPAAAS